jgi:hypothetical protein
MSYIPSKLNLSSQCITDSAFVVAVAVVPEALPSPEEDLVVEVAPLVLGPVATVRLVDSYPLGQNPEDNMLYSDNVLTVGLDESGRLNRQATTAISEGNFKLRLGNIRPCVCRLAV